MMKKKKKNTNRDSFSFVYRHSSISVDVLTMDANDPFASSYWAFGIHRYRERERERMEWDGTARWPWWWYRFTDQPSSTNPSSPIQRQNYAVVCKRKKIISCASSNTVHCWELRSFNSNIISGRFFVIWLKFLRGCRVPLGRELQLRFILFFWFSPFALQCEITKVKVELVTTLLYSSTVSLSYRQSAALPPY